MPALIAFKTDYITGGIKSRSKSIANVACDLHVFSTLPMSLLLFCFAEQVATVDIITTQLFFAELFGFLMSGIVLYECALLPNTCVTESIN